MPRKLIFVLAAIIMVSAAQSSVACDSVEESVGLASEPLPAVTRNRCLTDSEVAAFAQSLRDETVSDVLRVLGLADDVVQYGNSEFRLRYAFDQSTLEVSIRHGRVCNVGPCVIINAEEQERQTGVRDDDFVGLVGP